MAHLQTLAEFLAELPPQQLGTAVDYAPGSSDGPNTSRRLAGLEVPHHLTGSWVVTLGEPNRVIPDQALGAQIEQSADIHDAIAIVQWGSGGVMHTAEIDWRQGASHTFYGNAINVSSRVPSPIDPLAGGTLRLRASVAPGRIEGHRPTRTLQGPTLLGPTLSYSVAVPRFARTVYPLFAKTATLAFVIAFFRVGNTLSLATYQYVASANRVDADRAVAVPVPTDATLCTFTNLSATTNISRNSLMFELAL